MTSLRTEFELQKQGVGFMKEGGLFDEFGDEKFETFFHNSYERVRRFQERYKNRYRRVSRILNRDLRSLSDEEFFEKFHYDKAAIYEFLEAQNYK